MSTVYLRERDAFHVPPAPDTEAQLQHAARALLQADALLFTAGAGFGVDSGLPDFRTTATNLFSGRTDLSYEELSDSNHFSKDPPFAWGVNYTQLQMYRKAEPHKGYGILRRWSMLLGKPYFVYTSNIDGHFAKAGFPPSKIVACHGDLHHLQCCDRACSDNAKSTVELDDQYGEEVTSPVAWPAKEVPSNLKVDEATMRMAAGALEQPCFRCPRCAGLARPNVWFCTDTAYRPREEICEASGAFHKWLTELQAAGRKVVVVEVGAGLAIPSVRVASEDAVAEAGDGSCLIRINPTDCRVPSARAIGLPLGGRDGLERLDAELRAMMRHKPARKG